MIPRDELAPDMMTGWSPREKERFVDLHAQGLSPARAQTELAAGNETFKKMSRPQMWRFLRKPDVAARLTELRKGYGEKIDESISFASAYTRVATRAKMAEQLLDRFDKLDSQKDPSIIDLTRLEKSISDELAAIRAEMQAVGVDEKDPADTFEKIMVQALAKIEARSRKAGIPEEN